MSSQIQQSVIMSGVSYDPNVVAQRTALFNPDGSPFGKRVVFKAKHDAASAPTTFDTLNTGEQTFKRVGLNYNVPWSEGSPYFAPDLVWFKPGDTHPSWGLLPPGEFCFDMLPNKLYAWSIIVEPNLYSGAVVYNNIWTAIVLNLWVQVFPDSVDGWGGSNLGFYPTERFLASVNSPDPYSDLTGPFNNSDVVAAFSKKHGGFLTCSGSFLNDGLVNMSLDVSINNNIGVEIYGTSGMSTFAHYKVVSILITEEDI